MAAEFGNRVAFAHLRNINFLGDRSFDECAHWRSSGSIDLCAVINALVDAGFDGGVRADHGRMIWGEKGKPGYGLFDRALGSQYLLGLIDALNRKAPRPAD